jgi:hypothetical protein
MTKEMKTNRKKSAENQTGLKIVAELRQAEDQSTICVKRSRREVEERLLK